MRHEPTVSRRYRIAVIAARALIAAASVFVILQIADAASIAQSIARLSVPALVVALAVHVIIILALAWRWAILVRATGSGIGCTIAVRMTFVSTVLNLTLPTSVGGDIGRAWLGHRQGMAIASATAAGILDRGIGLAALVAMVAAGAVVLGGRFVAALLLAACLAGALLLILLLRWAGRLPEAHAGHRLAAASRAALGSLPVVGVTVALSLAAHLGATWIAAVLAHGMGLELSAWHAALLFPAVLLATAIPVTIGGWGLRELAAIPVLSFAGIGAEGAAAVGLVFGLTQLAAASLGSLAALAPLAWRPSS